MASRGNRDKLTSDLTYQWKKRDDPDRLEEAVRDLADFRRDDFDQALQEAFPSRGGAEPAGGLPRWLSGLLIGLLVVAVLHAAAFGWITWQTLLPLRNIENRLPEEGQIEEILASVQGRQDTRKPEEPIETVEKTATPEDKEEVTTPTPEPTKTPEASPEEEQWTLSGYVYKGDSDVGVADVGVYVAAVGQDESESYDKLTNSTTEEDGHFTLEFNTAATQEQPLHLQLMVESHELWNHVRAVQPDVAGWTVPGDHEDRFEGEFTDPAQASGELVFHASIRREFTGHVKEFKVDSGIRGAQVLLLRWDGDTVPTTEDWETATAVFTETTGADGSFQLVDVSESESAYYQIRESQAATGYGPDLNRPPVVDGGVWYDLEIEIPDGEKMPAVQTVAAVEATSFPDAVTFYNLAEESGEVGVEVEETTILVPKEGATVHRYPGAPPGPADSRTVPSGTESLEVLGKWSEGDWWLACCINDEPLWIGSDDVEAPPTASVPTVYLPQIPEDQGWQEDSPDWILTYYFPKSSVKESTVVTWTLGSLEAGQYQLEAWVPSGHARARVQYEVVDGAGQVLEPVESVKALDQSLFSTEFKEIGIYALEEASEVVVRLDANSAVLGNRAYGVLDVGAGPLRVVRVGE